MGQLCPFVSFCAVLLSIKQKSKVSIQYNKIPLVKKDDDSIRTYRKKVCHRTYDTPSLTNNFYFKTTKNNYLGRLKALVISAISSWLIPSGSKPIHLASIYIFALLESTSIWSKASITSRPLANTPCFSHITTS